MTYRDIKTHSAVVMRYARAPILSEVTSPYVRTTQRADLAKIILRMRENDRATHRLCEKFFKATMPKTNKTTTTENGTLLWLGPEEILFRSQHPQSNPYNTLEGLEEALYKSCVALVDVSDHYTVIRLSGLRARRVLQKTCPINLHRAHFSRGDCARTLMAKAPILIDCPEPNTFDLQVQLSFADYTASLLQESALSEAPREP